MQFTWMQLSCLHQGVFYTVKGLFLLQYTIHNYFSTSKQIEDKKPSTNDESVEKVVDHWLQKSLLTMCLTSMFGMAVAGYHSKMDWAQVYPVDKQVATVGNVVASVATALMIWTQVTLGKSWSGVVSVQKDHKLITTGPYAWARHPMYAAGYLQPLGIWLMTNNWAMTLGWSLQKLLVTLRMPREDQLMLELFGEEYVCYHRKVGAILPFKPFGWDLGLSEQQVSVLLQSSKKKSKNN